MRNLRNKYAMIRIFPAEKRVPVLITVVILVLSFWVGTQARQLFGLGGLNFSANPIRILAGLAIVAVLGFTMSHLRVALTLLVIAAGTINISIGTGTGSSINIALIITALVTLAWLLKIVIQPHVALLVTSEVNRPLLLFIITLLVSWLLGYVLRDLQVIPPSNALIIQATQVALFVLSATALLLGANVPLGKRTLGFWTVTTILIAFWGQAHLAFNLPAIPIISMVSPPLSIGFVLLICQLMFNKSLKPGLWFLGWVVIAFWATTTFTTYRSSFVGGWMPIVVGAAIILWLRSKVLFFSLGALGVLALVLYPEPFLRAFGSESASGSLLRPYIWWDLIRMTFQSPVATLFGLGPVNYMWNWRNPSFVSFSQPLTGSMYINPSDPSIFYAPPAHNMFVDIYAQTGLIGFVLFVFVIFKILKTGLVLASKVEPGFMRAYVIGVVAAFAGLVVASGVAADWLVPFVYNIGLNGFRSSVYAWLMAGTLIGLYAQYENRRLQEGLND